MYQDIDNDSYVLKAYGKAMTRSPPWKPQPRIDLITLNYPSFTAERMIYFRIYLSIDTTFCRLFLVLLMITVVPFMSKVLLDQCPILNFALK